MRKTLLLLLAAVAVVGCKKNTEPVPTPGIGGEDAISVGAKLTMTKATLLNEFGADSRIGMFEAFFDAANKSITTFRQDDATVPATGAYNENLKYAFGTSLTAIWAPEADNKVLKWPYIDPADKSQGTTPIYLVGYHPHQDGATISDLNVLTFSVPLDQTKEPELRTSDLMWAMTAGTFEETPGDNSTTKFDQVLPGYDAADIKGTGLTKLLHSSKAVDLRFHHMLTKLSYNVRFIKPEYKYDATSAPTESQEDFKNPVITKIQLSGPDFTVSGKLDLPTGKYVADANAAGVSQIIKWEPIKENGDADPKAYVDKDGNDIVIKEIGNGADSPAATDYAYYCDMIAQPALFTNNTNNYIEFYVTFDYVSVDGVTTEKRDQIYRFALGGDPVTKFDKFERNQLFNLKAVIELNSDIINITTSIEPWTDANVGEIQPY